MDFDLEDGMRAQRALREALGLGPERFPLPAFIGMLSDEIEQMRAAGRSDADVSRIIETATGQRIEPSEIARHYASPEARHPHGDGEP